MGYLFCGRQGEQEQGERGEFFNESRTVNKKAKK